MDSERSHGYLGCCDPQMRTTYVVGWYGQATVFRKLREASGEVAKARTILRSRPNFNDPDDIVTYQMVTLSTDAYCVPLSERAFVVQRGKGFLGTANVWFPDGDQRAKLLEYIEGMERARQTNAPTTSTRLPGIQDFAQAGDTRERLGEMEREGFSDPNSYGSGEIMIREAFPGEGGLAHTVNTIPGGASGSCHETLVVAIGSNASENVELRVLRAVEHIWVKCRDRNRVVVFGAAKWDAQAWQKHASSFGNVTPILKVVGAAPTLLT